MNDISLKIVELSVVIPCLNEAESLPVCLEWARQGIDDAHVIGEIIVSDNGSTDGSQAIAASYGARVIQVDERGYGAALMGGIEAARGKYIVMGDADGSYDFRLIPRFLEELKKGSELVHGCRLARGGGRIEPGAMPFLHRWVGNPILTWLVRLMFKAPVDDVYCGLRGFDKSLYQRLNQCCTGMEFATEMVIKASLSGARISQIPIVLHRDARKTNKPHLRTFRDGWRTLRFFLLHSPRWLFSIPGMLMMIMGAVGYALALPGARIGQATLGVHTLLVSSLTVLLGFQLVCFAVFTKTYAITEKILPPDPKFERIFEWINLERGLMLSAIMMVVGIALISVVFYQWYQIGFGPLDYADSMRWIIPGALLIAIGFEGFFFSWFVSILGIPRR